MANEDLVKLGRRAVERGGLLKLRNQLGLTRNAMADLLYTAPATYITWEEGTANVRTTTAERVGRFVTHATSHLKWLRDNGIRVKTIMPIHEVAGALGVPQELLLKRYREDAFQGVDLGILGLWVQRSDLADIGYSVNADR